DEDDCQITKVNPPMDDGALLDTWLAILGGQIVDVAATGQCSWLACYAALHNVAESMKAPTSEVVDNANELKKQVLNGMIANLADEAQLHPKEVMVEISASGCQGDQTAPIQEQLCALANHYVAQRQKSVKTQVPLQYWVRSAHIKAMAMHARETIYVLDVQTSGMARMQAYAYFDEHHQDEDIVETGSVQAVATHEAIELMQDLVGAGILPPVMILRWQDTTNHFQAITYDNERYACYANN
ncbi:hypothetical protein PHYSODRAFT_400484, partial [Phytophthora sojae]